MGEPFVPENPTPGMTAPEAVRMLARNYLELSRVVRRYDELSSEALMEASYLAVAFAATLEEKSTPPVPELLRERWAQRKAILDVIG